MQTLEKRTSTVRERIVITGIGLMTPVGAGCWETVKSILDGRSFYRSHETVRVLDNPDLPSLRGATISRIDEELIPREIAGASRMAALLTPAIAECLNGLPVDLHGQTDWKIITPYSNAGDVVLAALAGKMPRIWLSSSNVYAKPDPRCEFISRIAEAREALLTRRIEGFVVACADSLCDTKRLNELMLAGRLKDADNPYGIMAGEAGGAVLLERESSARKRGVPILAALASWGSAAEPNPWLGGKPSKALGLTTAFHQAFEKLDDQGAGVVHVCADENGERARALEWALTAGRIFPNPEQERYLWHPAVVTGDAGGGLGAIAVADAITRLILNTPPSGRVAVAVSDDEGMRQVLCLEHVEQPERQEYLDAIRLKLGASDLAMEEK